MSTGDFEHAEWLPCTWDQMSSISVAQSEFTCASESTLSEALVAYKILFFHFANRVDVLFQKWKLKKFMQPMPVHGVAGGQRFP